MNNSNHILDYADLNVKNNLKKKYFGFIPLNHD